MGRLQRKIKMPVNSIFFNLLLNKKIKNNPNKNVINGILFPENIIATPKTHIANMTNKNIKFFLFFSEKATKNIEKNENFLIKSPAINSSPKNPEL